MLNIKNPIKVAETTKLLVEGSSAMAFFYTSDGLDDLFYKRITIKSPNGDIRGPPEKTNTIINMDDEVMLLAIDEISETLMTNTRAMAIQINPGCPVWNFCVSTGKK